MSDPFKDELIEALRSLRAFARTFHRDEARAEDLVQETMLKAWTKREQFQPGSNMKAWLFTILRNTYLSELRKKKREVEDADGSLVAGLAEKPKQDGHMAMRDFRNALELLSDDQREALILVGASGFSYDEAAEICGVASGTIKSRVSRARARIAELMGEGEPGTGESVVGDDNTHSSVDRGAQAI